MLDDESWKLRLSFSFDARLLHNIQRQAKWTGEKIEIYGFSLFFPSLNSIPILTSIFKKYFLLVYFAFSFLSNNFSDHFLFFPLIFIVLLFFSFFQSYFLTLFLFYFISLFFFPPLILRLVWFLCLMAYQLWLVIQCQSHCSWRTVVVLFNP